MNLKIIADIYTSVLNDSVYSSITAVYKVAKKEPVRMLGINCIGQAEMLRNALLSAGFKKTYYLKDYRHHAVLLIQENRAYYLDPYLMIVNPVGLSKLNKEKNKKSVFSSYPAFTGSPDIYSDLTVKIKTTGLEVAKYRYFPFLKTNLLTYHYRFNLDDRLSARPAEDDPKIAFDPEQNNLSVRTLDLKRKELLQIIYPIRETHAQSIVDKNYLFIRTNSGQDISYADASFRPLLTTMCQKLNCTENDLIDFVLGGTEIYSQLVPKDIFKKSR